MVLRALFCSFFREVCSGCVLRFGRMEHNGTAFGKCLIIILLPRSRNGNHNPTETGLLRNRRGIQPTSKWVVPVSIETVNSKKGMGNTQERNDWTGVVGGSSQNKREKKGHHHDTPQKQSSHIHRLRQGTPSSRTPQQLW